MRDRIEQLSQEIALFIPANANDLEQFRIRMLGKKGLVTELFDLFKAVPSEEKKELGQILNNLKIKAQEKLAAYNDLTKSSNSTKTENDLTRSPEPFLLGARHPLSLVRSEIIGVFSRLGFVISEGPEIEDDWHNFSALNFPEEHPARDMQDTFFIDNNFALRTHTSSVQVRVMEGSKPPIRTISPGRVYRNEAISARAHCQFHQLEGLYIDQNVSFADLKQTLLTFAKEMFGSHTKIRLRPSYFPFTEPSAEMDISCLFCKGSGCNICKGAGWVEILGCGMVDPNVLENCKIDSQKYTGFAFGMGIERITMLKYKINDLRLFFDNDVRFLNQFKSVV